MATHMMTSITPLEVQNLWSVSPHFIGSAERCEPLRPTGGELHPTSESMTRRVYSISMFMIFETRAPEGVL